MLKKVLVVVCAMSVLLMSGCINLGGVSQKDYDSAVADRDYFLNEYTAIIIENDELKEEIDSLEAEIEILEEDIIALEEELDEAMMADVEGMGEVVIYQITDEVALKFRLPEGFSYQSEGLYNAGTYDPSNILIQSSQTSSAGLAFTEDMMKEYLMQTYENLGYDVESFEMVNFERREIQGYEVLIMDMALRAEGLNIQQIEVAIQVDSTTCVMVYTTEESFGRYDDYLQSVETIQVGKAK